MENKQSQIKINLSTGLKQMVEKRAKRFGSTLAGYAKYLMMKDIEESEDLKPSIKMEKVLKSIRDNKAKFYTANSIEELDRLVDSVK